MALKLTLTLMPRLPFLNKASTAGQNIIVFFLSEQ